MRRLVTCLSALACLSGLLAAAPSATAAAPKPTITLTSAPTRISATHTWSFGYATHHLRRGSHVDLEVLQHGRWTPIDRSDPTHGSTHGRIDTQGPGELGTYTLRLAVLRHGRTVASSGEHTVFGYGTVSMKALCSGVLHVDGDCNAGTADAGHGQTLHYVMSTGINGEGQHRVQLSAPSTSCRSISLRYSGDTGEQNTLVLKQGGAKTQQHVTRDDRIQTFASPLTGQHLAVSVTQDDGELFMFWNGSASCYSADGKA